MSTQYTEDFKRDAITYWKEHPELGISKCAKNLGVSKSAYQHGQKYTSRIMVLFQREVVVITKAMKQRKSHD